MIIIIATDFLTLRGGNANLESSMRILWFSCHCLPAHSPAIVRWSKEPCSGGKVFTVILHALLSMQLTLVQLSKFWKASLQVSKLREAHAWKWKLTTPVFPDTRQVHAGRFFAIQRAKERRKCPHIFHGNLGFSFGYWYLPRMNLTQHLSSRHGPVRGTAHCTMMSGSVWACASTWNMPNLQKLCINMSAKAPQATLALPGLLRMRPPAHRCAPEVEHLVSAQLLAQGARSKQTSKSQGIEIRLLILLSSILLSALAAKPVEAWHTAWDIFSLDIPSTMESKESSRILCSGYLWMLLCFQGASPRESSIQPKP